MVELLLPHVELMARLRTTADVSTRPRTTITSDILPAGGYEFFDVCSIRVAEGDRYDESHRLKERFHPFDVEGLLEVAATTINQDSADVEGFRKLAEGGFNRVFEITMRDGNKLIARLPYPCAYPKHLSIASEVATMNLVRSHGVPVPKVLGYSTTTHNAVGSEYIIMEKVKGGDLGDVWYELAEKERIKVTVEVTKLESLLFSISLPAYGSIYYQRDLDGSCRSVEIPTPGHKEKFRLGPDVAQKWRCDKRDQISVNRGPCMLNLAQFPTHDP